MDTYINTKSMRKNIKKYVTRNCDYFELPVGWGSIDCNGNFQLFNHLIEISKTTVGAANVDWYIEPYFQMQKHFHLEAYDIDDCDDEIRDYYHGFFVPDSEKFLEASGYEDSDELKRDMDDYFYEKVKEYYEAEKNKWLEEHPYIEDVDMEYYERIIGEGMDDDPYYDIQSLITDQEEIINEQTLKHFNLKEEKFDLKTFKRDDREVKVQRIWAEECEGDGYTYDLYGYIFDDADIEEALRWSGYDDINKLCSDMEKYYKERIENAVDKIDKAWRHISEDRERFGLY